MALKVSNFPWPCVNDLKCQVVCLVGSRRYVWEETGRLVLAKARVVFVSLEVKVNAQKATEKVPGHNLILNV